jgi:hypothetical protein
MAALPLEAPPATATECATAAHRRPRALDVSRAKTHDAALDILKAYKLSGNFHGNLDVVLRDMGLFDMVTHRAEPHPALAFPDCRHVVFIFSGAVADDRCDDIIRAIAARIGFDTPWWGRLLRRHHAEPPVQPCAAPVIENTWLEG